MARIGTVGATAFAVALFAAHFLHLDADFPNFSPWMDYAKYTDEGWYGNAAVAYFVTGGWYVPGDFNPAVALPVWPFFEWVLFHFTGVSLPAARALAVAVFGGNLALAYALVRRQSANWTALLAVAVLASNAYLYCFSRLAILEPLMIFLLLLCWWFALKLPQAKPGWRRSSLLVCMGALLCAMVLTKTTAVFLLPSVLPLLWHGGRGRPRAVLASSGVVALAALVPWLAYFLALVRPSYLADYRYLFAANVYPQPTTLGGWLMAFWYSLHGTLWIGPRFAAAAAGLILLAVLLCRELWRAPLFAASLLAATGYLFFIGFHNNMQPRYYQVVAVPLVIAAALALHALSRRAGAWAKLATYAASAAVLCAIWVNTRETLGYAFHPEYTFVNAARNLTRYVDEHPNRNRLLLSISGSNIALATGLPAICDDFGTLDLPERIRRYQPGWYAAWNELDPGTLEDLHTQFNLEQVANFPAYDDEDRNNLILYKLTPLEAETPEARPRRRSRPKPLGALAGKPAEMQRAAD